MKRNSLPKLSATEAKIYLERKNSMAIPTAIPEFKSVLTNMKNRKRSTSIKSPNISSSRKSAFSLPQNACTYYLQVIFLSNYGNESIIGCSEIDVLDIDYKVLTVASIGLDDQKDENDIDDDNDPLNALKVKHKNDSIPPYLSSLVNSSMIKDSDTQEWNAHWNGTPIHFNLKVVSPNPPASIRIWNSRETDHRSVKNVKIIAGGTFIASGIIPEGFGGIISLEKSKAIEKNVFSIPFPRPETKTNSDKYGEIPNKPIKTLKFSLYESFDKSDYIGLASIEITAATGKIVTLDDIKSISYDNINFMAAPHRLINNINNTKDSRNIQSMWYGSFNHRGTPQITITFKKALPILLIRIWNIPKQVNGDNFGVSKIGIFFENEIVAIAPLKKIQEKDRKPSDFWFTDVPFLRQNIPLGLS